MVAFFNTVVNGLLNTYLPLQTVYRHSEHQYAWSNGNETEYKLYRNKVQRAARYLRNKYYNNRVKALKHSNSHRWWREIKRMTGQGTKLCPLTTLANNDYCGDMTSLSNKINRFFAEVSKDLQPLSTLSSDYVCADSTENLSDYVIYPHEVKRKLNRVNVRKSCGPDNIPN
jgi:hypothetical protein